MKLQEIVSAFKNAKPSELREAAPLLREAMAATERPHVPTPEERDNDWSLLHARQVRDREEHEETLASARAEEVSTSAALERARVAHEAACSRLFDIDTAGFVARREERAARLWAVRPAWLDRVTTKLEAEAARLRPRSAFEAEKRPEPLTNSASAIGEILPEGLDQRRSEIMVSDEGWVEARAKAIRFLAATVRRFAVHGRLGTLDEVEAFIAQEREKLPAVPTIAKLLEPFGERGRALARRLAA